MMLAAAGIPLYIHLPRFVSVELGIGLGTLGVILMAIRLVDLIQDPLFGWMIDHWPRGQLLFGLAAALGLALGFPLLFAAQPATPLALGAVLVLLFSAYSLGTILLYGRSETLAEPDSDLLTIAFYRETGILLGVILGAILPTIAVAAGAQGQGYSTFGWALGLVAVAAGAASIPMWQRPAIPGEPLSRQALVQSGSMALLGLALVNALPVAITSTLFVFFVEDRLNLTGWSGPFLVLFFAAALVSLPFWRRVSTALGARQTLLISMPLAILSFIGAAALGTANTLGFALVCLGSGAALGADMLLLPALFSVALAKAGLNAGQAFGFWSFAGKIGLALAAFTVLPLLDTFGFQPGGTNTQEAMQALNVAYALLPCALKCAALAMVWQMPKAP